MECHGEHFMCPYQQEEDRHIAEGAHVGNDDLDVGAVDQETRLGSASNEMIVRRLEKKLIRVGVVSVRQETGEQAKERTQDPWRSSRTSTVHSSMRTR